MCILSKINGIILSVRLMLQSKSYSTPSSLSSQMIKHELIVTGVFLAPHYMRILRLFPTFGGLAALLESWYFSICILTSIY